MGQRDAVDVFQITTHRQSAREPGDPHVEPGQQLLNVGRGDFAFHRRIRRQDHFAHPFFAHSLDQAVESITPADGGGTDIALRNRRFAVMPVDLELTLADGSKLRVRLPVEIWQAGDRFVYRAQTTPRVVRAEIDPDRTLPDAVPANNAASAP